MPAEQSPRQLDWSALLDEALSAPGNLTGVYDRFHTYSFTNMLLFRSQGIQEPVASFKRWQSLGRHVLRGARAKEVIVPIMVTEPDVAPASEAETVEEQRARLSRLIGFKVVRAVFAYSDTDGPEVPAKPVPQWDEQRALDSLKIRRVPFHELNGNIQGYSRERELAINPMAVYPEKTLLHELGHIVLGHTVTTRLGEYAQHRGKMEFGAEATAYLVGHELDIIDESAAAHSRGYIRQWLQNERPGDREIRLVFAAADQILRAGRTEVGAPMSADGAAAPYGPK